MRSFQIINKQDTKKCTFGFVKGEEIKIREQRFIDKAVVSVTKKETEIAYKKQFKSNFDEAQKLYKVSGKTEDEIKKENKFFESVEYKKRLTDIVRNRLEEAKKIVKGKADFSEFMSSILNFVEDKYNSIK